jgi:hypothetical protein
MTDLRSTGSTHETSVKPAHELKALRIEMEELRRDKELLDTLERRGLDLYATRKRNQIWWHLAGYAQAKSVREAIGLATGGERNG